MRTSNSAVISRLVVGTDLLVLCHERLAGDLAAQDRREVALPVELPPITETAWSHPSRQLDPGHRWLLDVLLAESAELPQPGAVPSR